MRDLAATTAIVDRVAPEVQECHRAGDVENVIGSDDDLTHKHPASSRLFPAAVMV